MNKRTLSILVFALAIVMAAVATPVSETVTSAAQPVVVTDMIGRNVEVVPGSYHRVVCIGAPYFRQGDGQFSVLFGELGTEWRA